MGDVIAEVVVEVLTETELGAAGLPSAVVVSAMGNRGMIGGDDGRLGNGVG